jgi:hypothetical protein
MDLNMVCEDLIPVKYPEIPGEKRTPDRNIRCCICGHWITKLEYGGVLNGTFVDFIEKNVGNLVITMCHECIQKVIEYSGDD